MLRPNIIFYGVTGVGKSLLGKEVLKITNGYIFPTDLLRKLAKIYIKNDLLEKSTYNVSDSIAVSSAESQTLIAKFKLQSSLLYQGIECVLNWGDAINSSVIVEGVNAYGYVERAPIRENVFTFLITCIDKNKHFDNLKRRFSAHPRPPISLEHYHTYYSNIAIIQNYLVSDALSRGIKIFDFSTEKSEEIILKIQNALLGEMIHYENAR